MNLPCLVQAAAVLCVGFSPTPGSTDWLVDSRFYVAAITTSTEAKTIALTNGLVTRTLRIAPNAATVALNNLMTGEAELRSVRPEATLLIDGRAYDVGGLVGQPIHNYRGVDPFLANSFCQFASIGIGQVE